MEAVITTDRMNNLDLYFPQAVVFFETQNKINLYQGLQLTLPFTFQMYQIVK